jgi:hypothetical protein
VLVEQVEVRGRVEQALRLVLAVDGREEHSELAQQRDRHQGAVDGRPTAAVRRDLAADDDLVGLDRQAVPGRERGSLLAVPEGLDRAGLLARAHQIRRGPGAQDEAQGVHHDRLPGARLAREEGQPGRQLDLDLGDYRDIVDFKILKHLDVRSGYHRARAARSSEKTASSYSTVEPFRVSSTSQDRGRISV